MMAMPHTLKVRMSREFAYQLFVRDAHGNKLTVEWGDPDDEGFYNPVFSVDYDDNVTAVLEQEIATLKGYTITEEVRM